MGRRWVSIVRSVWVVKTVKLEADTTQYTEIKQRWRGYADSFESAERRCLKLSGIDPDHAFRAGNAADHATRSGANLHGFAFAGIVQCNT